MSSEPQKKKKESSDEGNAGVRAEVSDGWMEPMREALLHLLPRERSARISAFLDELTRELRDGERRVPATVTSPYVNTIPVSEQAPFPGDKAIERQIKSFVRWNAMAMVVNANRQLAGIGGHISTFASCATLYEVGFNHFFRGGDGKQPGDIVYFQGHASPGNYARAFLEGRLSETHLHNFRQELADGGGLSSYPHPYLMPEFWQFPTVSMGLSPIMSIYQARFNRYRVARGLAREESEPRVWCFLGDGEMDEPESLGAIGLAGRERLDNLTWVVNCNLQRLDVPVRGNSKIIQELEGIFRGAGWNVIKVIWGSEWDPLLEADTDGLLVKRMEEAVDGDYQKYSVSPGSFARKHFFGKYPELADRVNHLTDEQIRKLRRGGHDPEKVYAAYHAASNHTGAPTVILAKTIKGYGLGEAGEGSNVTHQQKKLNERELREFRDRFAIPISDEQVVDAPFYRPAANSKEMRYLKERRKELGGPLPRRSVEAKPLSAPSRGIFQDAFDGTGDKSVSTTMAFVRILSQLLRDKKLGPHIVPIIPDEARTFGMDALFRQTGIYSPVGQLYEPVDQANLLYYRETEDGQILEEGISEAGSISSFIAAGTSYATHRMNMIPFFVYYSMFGFQRIGDLIWAAGDVKAKGFLVGGTAGRTALNGEGLQHQDGHTHLMASAYPTLLAYDPAFAYEVAVIVRDGIRRMFEKGEEIQYYMTLYNENYPMPAMPEGAEEGILRGLYRLHGGKGTKPRVHLFGSGPLLPEAVRAQEILAEQFDLSADVWSVTSYKMLRTDAIRCRRWNMLHPDKTPKRSYLETTLQNLTEPVVAVSDSIRAVPDQIAPWVPHLLSLGTDGFGRSDSRPQLRRFFEVDAETIAVAALYSLSLQGKVEPKEVKAAIRRLDIDPEKIVPEIL